MYHSIELFFSNTSYTHTDTCANRHTYTNNIETLGTGSQQGRNEKKKKSRILQKIYNQGLNKLYLQKLSRAWKLEICLQKVEMDVCRRIVSLSTELLCLPTNCLEERNAHMEKGEMVESNHYFSSNKLKHLCGGEELRQSMGEITPQS